MSAPLNLSKVTIVDELGESRDLVGIRLRRGSNLARIESASGALIRERADAAGVTKLAPSSSMLRWQVEFADGAVWVVSRKKGGCGCGR